MRYFLFFLLPLIGCGCAFAQRANNDTTELRAVTVYAFPYTQYAVGSKVLSQKVGDEVNTLAGALAMSQSTYLKTYGNNQLSTLSLRGTSASQSAVLWNGININSPSLGLTDAAIIPLFFVDDLSLQYGTSSALYGSDAIGGTLMLNTAAPFRTQVPQVFVFQEIGSFGRTATGLKFSVQNKRFESITKIFDSFMRNNFPFESPAVGYRKIQQHAAVRNYGIDQIFNVRINETSLLSAEGMFTSNWRQVQPVVTSGKGTDELHDEHVRARISYSKDFNSSALSATLAYIKSDQDFKSHGVTTNVTTHQYTALVTNDQQIGKRSALRYGMHANLFQASSQAYNHVTDSRVEAFASYRYAVNANWVLNINVRPSMYDGKFAPLSPTISSSKKFVFSEQENIVWRVQAGRGYRVPTINDRYWQPGGNALLRAEDAYQVESGLQWQSSVLDQNKISAEATVYRTWLDQMIVWMPQGTFWRPSNLQRVHISGAEVSASLEQTFGQFIVDAKASYSFTQSTNKDALHANDHGTKNKQLPYVPLHSARGALKVSWRKTAFQATNIYNGLRYTTLSNAAYQSLPSYYLLDLSASHRFVSSKVSFLLKGEVRNVFGSYYENVENNAMPGRNFITSVTIYF